MKKKLLSGVILSFLFISACSDSNPSNWSRAEKGTAIGAASGALLGGVIGSNSDNTGTGALIGGALGAGAGNLIGRNQDEERDEGRYRGRYDYDRDRYYRERHGYWDQDDWDYRY